MPLIDQLTHTAGNTIRRTVDYSNWLPDGVTLVPAQCSVALVVSTSPITDVTLVLVQVLPDHLIFSVAGGSVSEVFTVQVTVGDSYGEKDISTIGFSVIAP